MIQPDDKNQPVELPQREDFNPDAPTPAAVHAASTTGVSRRHNFICRLIALALSGLILFMLLMVGSEWLARREHLRGLRELSVHIDKYQEQFHRLPSPEQVKKFKFASRISIDNIKYEDAHILDDSPPETPLAYTSFMQLRFLRSGHGVLFLDGRIRWTAPEVLKQELADRDRHYNGQIIKNQNE